MKEQKIQLSIYNPSYLGLDLRQELTKIFSDRFFKLKIPFHIFKRAIAMPTLGAEL